MSKFDQNISQAVSELEQKGIFNKKIILFGAGDNSSRLYEELNYRGYFITGVIDNNHNIVGNLFYGYRIQYAPVFLQENHIDTIYLVLSSFYHEIKKQMEKTGLIENKDFYPVVNIDMRTFPQNSDVFINDLNQLIKGKELYTKLVDTYGENTEFLINPATSIGDIYLMSFYIKAYFNTHKNTVLILGSNILIRLANSLKMGQCIYMPISDVLDLIKFAQVFEFEKNNLMLLHTGVVHFRIWSRMLTYLNITWMEHFKELFDLPAKYKPNFQLLPHNEKAIELTFKENNMQKGKTVILSPYANTVRQIPLRFWDELAEVLVSKGFSVYTNIGKDSEIPVKRTLPLFIDVNNFTAVVEEAGYFIGLRSGLCDLLLPCNAKKIIILYSDEIFDLISVYNFFSLERMGRTCPVIEEVIHKGENLLTRLKMYIEDN